MVPSHFNATAANRRTRAVQGCRRYARTRRRSRIPTPTRSGAAGNVASTSDVLRRRFMGRILLQTAHRRTSTEGVRFRASPSCFRPPPLVPGLFWFRARVILLTDGPTRSIQRLPVRGKVPTFPHPEPPLLLVLLGVAPSPGPNRGLSLVTPRHFPVIWACNEPPQFARFRKPGAVPG